MLKNQIAMSKGARACIYYSKFENFYPQWDIHVTKMKKELVYGCGVSFPENKNIGLLR